MPCWNPEIEMTSRDALRAVQEKRLLDTVEKMYAHVAPYRKKMDEIGLLPGDIKSLDDLYKLPFTQKQDLRDAYPFGLFAVPMSEIVRVHASSGTTGKPVIINEWGYSSLQWGEKLTDLERKNFYNQDVCRNKYWDKVWGKGHTPEAQAEYVIRCQEIFAQHPNVIGNFFFRWSDAETCWQCGEPDCPAECAWGCVDTHEHPKPAYWALKEGNQRYFNKG